MESSFHQITSERGSIKRLSRRRWIGSLIAGSVGLGLSSAIQGGTVNAFAAEANSKWEKSTERGLAWLAKQQTRLGQWNHKAYPTAITALAGTALIASGSTTTQGPYAKHIRRTVDFLLSKCRKNGLIGDPQRDNRYTYGHGFSMLFLSQVMGEEEDTDRRSELSEVLERAVKFSIDAQTKAGGWGYVSGKRSDFDEGSTTITQVQGLRGCRNAGIVVPTKAIDIAKKYIYDCQNDDGGISYSSTTKGTSRAAITAAALAALNNAGDYENEQIEPMWKYCKGKLHNVSARNYGHWHYTYLYYAQVVYRRGPKEWKPFRDKLYNKIVSQQLQDGRWTDESNGDDYVTACNLIMLQLDNGFLPIYQR